jgi:hypothetical protein
MTVPKRFGVLRFFATLLKVFAWIILVVFVLSAIPLVLVGTVPPESMGVASGNLLGVDLSQVAQGGGIIGGIAALLLGLLNFLILYVVGESVHMQIAVEENTRLTAALLLRMHQDGQADSTPGYGTGGFANDPYES